MSSRHQTTPQTISTPTTTTTTDKPTASHLLHGVVVEDPDVHVIARRHEPLLAHDEPRAPYRERADLERLHHGSGLNA